MSGPVLYAPDGNAVSSVRPEVHWPPAFMRMLAIFAANCGDTALGIHCTRCKQALQGHNAREDNFWQMECQCRKYVGRNPIPMAQRRVN